MIILSKVLKESNQIKILAIRVAAKRTLDNALLLIREIITTCDNNSEDVDIALSREFLGFSGELSKTQISDRLRRAACSFVREKMQHDVRKALVDLGIRADAFSVDVVITPVTTTDPEVITITYHSLYEVSPYIKNTVKIEISGRSMMEPITLN